MKRLIPITVLFVFGSILYGFVLGLHKGNQKYQSLTITHNALLEENAQLQSELDTMIEDMRFWVEQEVAERLAGKGEGE